MISKIADMQPDNRFVEQLHELTRHEPQQSIDSLVIAHDDPHMMRGLAEATSDSAAALIPWPQRDWDAADGNLSETIDWVVRRLEVKGVILVAHSRGGTPWQRMGSLGDGAWKGRTNRLLARASTAQEDLQHAKDLVRQRVQQLCELPSVSRGIASGELLLNGLLYVAESGLFLIYDADCDDFRALMANASAA